MNSIKSTFAALLGIAAIFVAGFIWLYRKSLRSIK
jgi:hypothetical protein